MRPAWAPRAGVRRRLRAPAVVVATLLLVVLGCSGETPVDGSDAGTEESQDVDTAGATEPDGGPGGWNDEDDEPVDGDQIADGPGPPEAADDAEPQVRAVWANLFDDTLKSASSIERLVDEAVGAGANTIIAQVVRRHDAYYTSHVLPATSDPDLEHGLDVLASLLEAAKPSGLEVHAWVSVAPTWHATYDDLPAPAGWVGLERGRRAAEAERWVTRTAEGEWTDYLDVALPEVVDHVVAISTELVERYEIDGVHLDYVRYDGADTGYHPDALARFAQESGRREVPAPDDEAWSDWRRQQSRALIAEVRSAMTATDVDAQLSAAVIAWGQGPAQTTLVGTRTYDDALQDWAGWMRDGIVDAVYPMTYFRAHEPEQAAWFDRWVAFHGRLDADTDGRVVTGVGGWLNTTDAVVDQVRAAMAATSGAAVYSFQQPTDGDRAELWHRLSSSRWTTGPDPSG